jgi:Outer membrane protein beta-barrel domain
MVLLRRPDRCVLITVLLVACTVSSVASQDSPRTRFHGIALKQHFQLTSAWSYSYEDAVPPQTFTGTVEQGLGLGLQVSYAITPNLAPYFGVDLGSELTTESGQSWVAYGPGLEVRFPVSRRWLPYVSAGATRWVHRDGLDFSYTQMTFGGGLEVFVSGRLALHYGFRVSSPVSDGKDHFGTLATVHGTVRSHRFGLSWYLSRRGP